MSEVGPDQSEIIDDRQAGTTFQDKKRQAIWEIARQSQKLTPEQDKKMREIMMEDLGLKDRFMIFVDRARNALRRRSSANQTETQAPPTQQPPSTPSK